MTKINLNNKLKDSKINLTFFKQFQFQSKEVQPFHIPNCHTKSKLHPHSLPNAINKFDF